MKHTRIQTPRGFTLVEIIVSVGLFSVVMLVATAAYFMIVTLDKEARATNELVVNLSFAVDSIARNIRTGTAYNCDGIGNGSCSRFSFVDAQGQTVTYLLKSDNSIGQCTGAGACTSVTAVSVTDPRIKTEGLTFHVRGVGVGDMLQPQVLMSARGTMPSAQGRVVEFTIQTSATERFLEL